MGMFFLLSMPSMILMAAAVIPAVFLMVQVYKTDRLEPESPQMLVRLVIAGVISTLIAMILEQVGSFVLDIAFPEESVPYYAWLYFAIVGPAEEGAKYFMLKRRSWWDPEFNCQYDGVVYAVFVSLGFALAENVEYVFMYGMGTAMLRAVTAIPGHACFGVFMGIWYGAAKRLQNYRNEAASKFARIMAVAMPMVIHGAYDFIATVGYDFVFIIFIVVMFIFAFMLIKRTSRYDRYIA